MQLLARRESRILSHLLFCCRPFLHKSQLENSSVENLHYSMKYYLQWYNLACWTSHYACHGLNLTIWFLFPLASAALNKQEIKMHWHINWHYFWLNVTAATIPAYMSVHVRAGKNGRLHRVTGKQHSFPIQLLISLTDNMFYGADAIHIYEAKFTLWIFLFARLYLVK